MKGIQLSFEFDYDQLRDRELNDYLEGVREKPQVDPFFDTMEEWEDSRDTTPYNRENYGWEEYGD